MSALELDAVLGEIAGDLEGATTTRLGVGFEVSAGGIVVGVVAGGVAELRLRPAVASAALRTPDVAASGRGPGWIRFAPATVDDFALDRAVAWLESAVRLATEESPKQ